MSEFPERDLPPGRHHLLREHLLTEIRQNETKTAKDSKTPRADKRWFRPTLIAGAVAASIAAGVLVASPFGDQAAQAGPPSKETVRMLEEIAATAEKQPAPKDVRDDQYVYIKSKVGFMAQEEGKPAELDPVHPREIWLSVDGKHDELLHEPASGFDNEVLKVEGPPMPSDTNYRNLEKLPTDPVNMLDWLHKESDGSSSEDQATFVLVGDLLYESLMPPKQAAALYLAASKIPGVELIDDSVDAEGRHGVAIAREDQGERQELIFDKKTKEFLGERQVAVEDLPSGPKKGDVTGRSAVLERTVVDKAGQRP
ncbi:CU044_5270 family protein [Streptomyces sp. NBC_01381]|uniref:CU044_5270 family protein n=1 Tax=Streptomyces sp. NBC_01381 TaxID=2903845 RepID=UPI00224EE9D4|nr:CU044_5270 family protein [Streptomyces sp. NBC_01381]MCX4665293.1 CU044_5270 family protein [Streptomyces sp. NBC_01381]